MRHAVRDPGSHRHHSGRRPAGPCRGPHELQFEAWADALPISVWEEDFSAIHARFEELRAEGVPDTCAYLSANPDEVRKLAAMVKILGVNRKSVEILGAGSRERLIRGLPDNFTPGALLVFTRELCALAMGSTSFGAEIPILDFAGQPRTLWLHLAVKEGHEHDRSRVLVSFVDITERKLVEEALREREASLRLAQAVAKIGQWTVDTKTNGTSWSEEFQRILGLPSGASGGDLRKVLLELVHPEDRELLTRVVRTSDTPTRRTAVEFRIVRPDGEPRVLWALPGPDVVDSSGNVLKETGIIQDVTERRRAEEELSRTQRLESLGLFAGGIAHDFNNYLTGLFGHIELAISEAGEGTPAALTLEAAMDGFNCARDLTRQLLTFSKGGTPLREPLRVGEMIDAAANLSLSGSNVRCSIRLEPGIAAINADRGQMNQLLNNLLLNARQAMPAGGAVTLSARNRLVASGSEDLAEGRYVEIVIADEGIGIASDQLRRVFDPFYTTKPQGTGLGLATCFSIIRRHDGHIAVESEPGRGTTFTILLPAASDQARALDDTVRCTSAAARKQGRILIMDDDPMVAKAAVRLLSSIGYRVDSAPDGAQAVELYEAAMAASAPYDLVILDLTIAGGMGGQATIKKLCEIDPAVRAIVSSGYSDGPVLSDPAQYGFAGVLSKPYCREDVVSLLESILPTS